MSWAQCSACGQDFGGDWAFDRHRVNTSGQPGFDPAYDWRCSTPAELEAKGWHRDARGWWRTVKGFPARARSPRSPVGA